MDRGPAVPYISPAPDDRNDDESYRSIRASRITRLVERAQQGEREAFGDLYEIHRDAVHRIARFHLPISAVDDAVAETFLRAWSALPRYRNTGAPFAAWLHGIARHVIADVHRAGRRVEPRSELPDDVVPFEHADRLDLAVAIRALPDEQRRVIELKFLVGLRNPEVARVLDRSIGAVNALQWRALATLRSRMTER